MTGLVREWLLGVTCTALVLAIAGALLPKEGGVRKVCRLAGGLALMLAVTGPLLRLDEGLLAQAAEEYRARLEGYQAELEAKNNLIYQTIIEEETAAYISDKAEEMGIVCQAEVTFSYDENGVPCPWEVTARGVWTEERREAVGRLLEDSLGVPPQRQHYEESVP